MAYTKYESDWEDGQAGGTPIVAAALDQMEQGIYDASRIATPALTLAGSPVDGEIAILVDSTTNPSYQWMFRYNDGSASSYKWEFIGGTPARDEVLTAQATTSTTFVDLATVGPTFTVPRAGEYLVTIDCQINTSTTVGYTIAAIKVGSAAASDDLNVTASSSSAATSEHHPSATFDVVAAASDVVKMQYRVEAGASSTISRRHLTISPIRVS